MYGEGNHMKRYFYILTFSIVLCCPSLVYGVFTSIEQVSTYAQSLPEYPPKDNSDWLNPDYTQFHQKIKRGLLHRAWDAFLATLHLSTSKWNPSYFISL